MIKAVIFDWGGTLIDDPVPGLRSYCSQAFGVAENIYSEAFGKHANNFHLNAVPEAQIWREIASELGKKVPENSETLWKEAFISAYEEKKEMFELAKRLKKRGYKVGFLSNTELPAMEFFREQNYDMFHETIFSCEIGLAKPDERIFAHALDKLKVEPKEAVFIDDNPLYLKGAKKVGLEVIQFQNPEQVKEELLKLGVKE